ncbi:MAG: triose-phosphate isomerase [Ottowia sp.]|nr:triose-phosphate isomerase [Ottowia sp.]
MVKKKLVIGNWKMQGDFVSNAALLQALVARPSSDQTDVAVCVPYPYISQCQAILAGSSVGWGAQDVSVHRQGAFTGEVSAAMLREFACTYVLVGHSERRAYHGESDSLIVSKIIEACFAGITPVLCVGETAAQRESGQTQLVVGTQLQAALAQLQPEQLAHLVLAYEPVWAIGTGKTASNEQAQDVHAFLRQKVAQHDADLACKMNIIYGGSVNRDNAGALFSMPDIDGGLVGGASRKADDFLAICHA